MYSASEDRSIKIWDLLEDRLLHVFENAHGGCFFLSNLSILTSLTDTIWSLALDKTEKILISGAEDRTVKVWDLEQKKLLYSIPNAEMSSFNLQIINLNEL